MLSPGPDNKPRYDLGGVFVRELNTNTVVLAHQGIVTYGTRLKIDQFLDEWAEINTPLIRAYGNARPFALIGPVDSLQLADEKAFVKNVCEAKEGYGDLARADFRGVPVAAPGPVAGAMSGKLPDDDHRAITRAGRAVLPIPPTEGS
jgi:hypothetical protein